MSQVIFDPEAGGDGSTVSDDGNPSTGLAKGGHITRFVPALANIVGIGLRCRDYAIKTGAYVYGTYLSAKEWAVGTFTRGQAGGGSSKDWAQFTGATVDDAGFSAKEHATGSVVPTGSAKDWAQLTGDSVDGAGYSAKEHAVGVSVPTGSAKSWKELAERWATETVNAITGGLYGARYYANLAMTYAAAALNAPGTVASSTTSNTIGTGTKNFTIQTGKTLIPGMFMMVARTSVPANYMVGQIISYDSGTGALSLNITDTNGSGTYTDWSLSLTAFASLAVSDDNSNADRYLVFVSGTGQQLFKSDINTGALKYNPFTGNLQPLQLTTPQVTATQADITSENVGTSLVSVRFKLPAGNTAARPAGADGDMWANTQTGQVEAKIGGVWNGVGGILAKDYTAQAADKQLAFGDMSSLVRASFNATGLKLILPDATTVPNSSSQITIQNPGTKPFSVYTYGSATQLTILQPGEAVTLLLYDRSTAAGGWASANAKKFFRGGISTLAATASVISVCQIDAGKLLAFYKVSNSNVSALALSFSGSEITGVGSPLTVSSTSGVIPLGCAYLSAGKALVAYGASTTAAVVVSITSGLSLSVGLPATIDGTNAGASGQMMNTATDRAVLAYGSSTTLRAVVISVTGTTPSPGSIASGPAVGGGSFAGASGLFQVSAGKYVMQAYEAVNTNTYAWVFTVNTTTVISGGNASINGSYAFGSLDTDVLIAFGNNQVGKVTITGTTPAIAITRATASGADDFLASSSVSFAAGKAQIFYQSKSDFSKGKVAEFVYSDGELECVSDDIVDPSMGEIYRATTNIPSVSWPIDNYRALVIGRATRNLAGSTANLIFGRVIGRTPLY